MAKKLNIKYKTIDMSNFSKGFDCDTNPDIVNKEYPVLCYNFETRDNTLSCGYGLETFSFNSTEVLVETTDQSDLPNSISEILYFYRTKHVGNGNSSMRELIVVDDNNNYYEANLWNFGSKFVKFIDRMENCTKSQISTYNYDQDTYYVVSMVDSSKNTKIFVGDLWRMPTEFAGVPFIKDICVHNNVMYLLADQDDNMCVYYTEDLNPYNIATNIPYMQRFMVPKTYGDAVRLVSFDEKLFIFTEYGIFQVDGMKNQANYYVEEVYSGLSKLLPKTLVKGNDNIIFTTDSGVYTFNGIKVEKLDLKIYSLFLGTRKNKAVACFNDNKYYLSIKLNYDSSSTSSIQNNALLIYDFYSKTLCVNYNISVRGITVVQDAVKSFVACTGLNSVYSCRVYKIEKNGCGKPATQSQKVWQSQKFNLNDAINKKLIKNIYIKTTNSITVELMCDDKIYTYSVSPSSEIQSIRVDKKAVTFAVRILANNNAEISLLQLQVGEYHE